MISTTQYPSLLPFTSDNPSFTFQTSLFSAFMLCMYVSVCLSVCVCLSQWIKLVLLTAQGTCQWVHYCKKCFSISLQLWIVNKSSAKGGISGTPPSSMSEDDRSLRVSIAVKRHHYHDNSYKGKYLVGVACLQFQRFNPFSSRWGSWWDAGRCSAGGVAESPISCK